MLKVLDKFLIPIFTLLLCVVYVAKTNKMEWIVIRYPYVIIAVIAVLLGSILISEMKNRGQEEKEKESVSPRQFILLTVSSLVYLLLTDVVGYFTTTLIFVAFLMHQLGNRNYKQIAIIAVFFTGLQYVFFRLVLNLPIPAGFIV